MSYLDFQIAKKGHSCTEKGMKSRTLDSFYKIKTQNRFEVLELVDATVDEEIEYHYCDMYQIRSSIIPNRLCIIETQTDKKHPYIDLEINSKKERSTISRSKEYTRCPLVYDKYKDDVSNEIQWHSCLTVSKRHLKKCKYCNFKKRSCVLNPHSCKAKTLYCNSCLKIGHFPRSINCKTKKLKNVLLKQKNKNVNDDLNNVVSDVSICNSKEMQSKDVSSNFMKSVVLSINDKESKCDETNTCTDINNIFLISQLDGNDDFLSSTDEAKPSKKVFAVNCELKEVTHLINFIRSFNTLWICTEYHPLCSLSENCFLCNIRSSCLRIRQERATGPKSLKVNEFTCQLNQYGSNWRSSITDLSMFINQTVALLISYESSVGSKFCW